MTGRGHRWAGPSIIAFASVFLAMASVLVADEPETPPPITVRPVTTRPATVRPTTSQPVGELPEVLETIRANWGLPALGAAIVRSEGIEDLAVVGVRKMEDATPVTAADRFHIGSCTKAMTATVAAVLVDQGKLRWDLTVGEAFGDIKEKIRDEYWNVTLEQLLTHRSGLPDDREVGMLFMQMRMLQGEMREQRKRMVELAFGQPAEAKPGEKRVYSNMGYVVAGAMAEQATGRAWEELVREMLFAPLGMVSAGFGAPGEEDAITEPYGHRVVDGGAVSMSPSAWADNPPCMGPAGTVHCSLGDWAKFVRLHLRGARGEAELVSANGFARLHTAPAGFDYAMGWGTPTRDWAGGRTLAHAGSNGLWYAVVWIAPEKDAAYLVVTNCGPGLASQACEEVLTALRSK